jgi:hypothetical protein
VHELITYIDGREWKRLTAPDTIAPRAWILGVVAVQLTVENGVLSGQVRASVTGSAAETAPLGAETIVHLGIDVGGPLPEVALPAERGMALYLDGAPVDRVAATGSEARAFGHVFCRWLRAGGSERGFDLTDFLSLPPGVKYERRVSRPLEPGQLVSYAIRL